MSVLQTVLVSAGQCDSVFKGFSDCLLQLGENMANYPQDLDDRENLHKICKYVPRKHPNTQTPEHPNTNRKKSKLMLTRSSSKREDGSGDVFLGL